MKVWIKILDLPELVSVFGERKFAFSFPGETLHDLCIALLAHYGPALSRIFLDPEGQLNKAIRVVVNGRLCAPGQDSRVFLKEGDKVAFVVFLEGG
jgi:ThiS family